MNDKILHMQDVLAAQKAAFLNNSHTSVEERIDRLKKLKSVFLQHHEEFAQAISKDFTNRAIHETYFGELVTINDHIDATIKQLPKWMKNEKRHVSVFHQPGKGWVQYQPLGVVGIISPWNYPLLLSMGPLISALAAGNHAMLKPSSAVPNLTRVLAEKFAQVFPENLIYVVQGSGELSKAFSKMPFNQITFTGSSRVGKTIMTDAAANLTPVLLELGGKSPAVIHHSYDVTEAAKRIVFGKFWNAGQTCVAPDYLMVPKGSMSSVVEAFKQRLQTCYPTLVENPDYTSIISQQAKLNLLDIIEDARSKGASIVECNPANENFDNSQKIPPTLVFNTTEDMRICQEEIFGPVLLIKEYQNIDESIGYINSKPHPLALYYFDNDDDRAGYFAKKTTSGHLGLNQTLTHVTQDDLPFGGVGNSGMGKYHGMEGFKTMSNSRSVMQHGRVWSLLLIAPPFNKVKTLLSKKILR